MGTEYTENHFRCEIHGQVPWSKCREGRSIQCDERHEIFVEKKKKIFETVADDVSELIGNKIDFIRSSFGFEAVWNFVECLDVIPDKENIDTIAQSICASMLDQ